MTGGTLATPFILSIPMCFSNNTLVISEVMSTTFFACGIVTLLQSTFGVRWECQLDNVPLYTSLKY